MSKIGVIILAAGKGTRMESDLPKVCFELGGRGLIQWVVGTALKLDPDRTVIVVGYEKEQVITEASNTPYSNDIWGYSMLRFVEQKNQLGTGDAVKTTQEYFENFNGSVFVLCGDVPLLRLDTLKKMLETHETAQASCTVLTMILDNPDKYGRMLRDSQNRLMDIVEYKDATEEQRKIAEVNTGIYCFNSQDLFQAIMRVNDNNAQKEYYLTDVINILYKENKLIESVVLEDVIEASGVNSQAHLAELEKICEKYNENWWY